MPELPEVETTKTSLTPLLGQTVQDVRLFQPQLRWKMPNDLDDLTGYQLTSVTRRAKYLLLTFTASAKPSKTSAGELTNKPSIDHKPVRTLIIHLGMSGSLQQHDATADIRKHDHLVMTFTDTNQQSYQSTQLHYHDPRRFGAIVWHDDFGDKLLNHLGVEPLEDDFTGQYLYQAIQRPDQRPITRAIKSVIMDQQIVVGVGNIYATESLFLSGIHPATPAHLLNESQLTTLVHHIRKILATAIEKGGSSLRDFTVGNGKTGYFQQTLWVYGRHKAACLKCETPLGNLKINGRASVYCPQCQPLNSAPD